MTMSAKDFGEVESNKMNKLSEDDETVVPLKNENTSQKCQGRKAVCECFREYSASTSIHGVQYLGETNRPMWERLFWIVVFIISIYTCSSMIYRLWRKWNDTPVIVSFDEREMEIWKIPFPAVTVCPQKKSESDQFRFEEALNKPLENWTYSENASARALLNICELASMVGEHPLPNDTDDIDVIAILKEIAAESDPEVTFKGQNFGEIASPILTDEGICYNFNGLRAKDIYADDVVIPDFYEDGFETDWTRENGYKKSVGIQANPIRVLGPGIKLGLDLDMITLDSITDNLCSLPADGYKVLIHSPDNIPLISSKFFNLPPKQQIIAAIKPNMMWTSEELRSYSPEKRQCFFNNEKTLKYFKTYTQINCHLECITDFTLSKCGCVKFSMPRLNGTRICQKYDEIECYRDADKEFLNFEEESESSDKNFVKKTKDGCNCLPPCTTIVYNIETSQSSLDISKLGKAMAKAEGDESILEIMSVSRLTVFFKEGSFLTSKRSELYGISEFVANCGGLLGLFMGFSVLSFVEIFYFSVIRSITNYSRRRRQIWL